MSEIKEIIDTLEGRIQKLLSKIKTLEENYDSIKVQLINSNNTIESQKEEINSLKTQCEALKIANSVLGGDENRRDTKLKINSLIREIDYCIAQLSD